MVTREKMMYVRTDNAPEFKGNIWATFFNENGLIHIPTAPYSSSSNGTADVLLASLPQLFEQC